jgi:hypothetical protein
MTAIISKEELKNEILDITLIDVKNSCAGYIQGADFCCV